MNLVVGIAAIAIGLVAAHRDMCGCGRHGKHRHGK